MTEAARDVVTGIPGMPGLSVEKIRSGLAEAGSGGRDRRVCMCGHPVARHKELRGTVRCQPSRMNCKCGDMTPAVEVSNTRFFLRKTEGPAERHALSRGLLAAVAVGVSVEWLIDVECSSCGSESAVPAGLMKTMAGDVRIAWENPEATRLLCGDCIEKLS